MQQIKQLNTWQLVVACLGGLLLLIGLLMAFADSHAGMVCIDAGALMMCSMQMLQRYEGTNFVVLRLRRQLIFSCLCILIGAALYTMQHLNIGPDYTHHNYWLIALTIGAVFQVYAVFRMDAELRKKAE